MLRIFKNLKRREVIFIAVSIVFILLQIWLDLRMPEYMSSITVLIETPGSEVSAVFAEGMKMLACALGSALTSVLVGYLASNIGPGFTYGLRQKVFAKISELGIGEMNRFSTPSLITRTTNDIGQVQMVISMGLQVLVKAPIMAVWAVLKIIDKSWQLSLVTAVAVVIMMSGVLVINLFVVPKFKIIQKKIDELNRITRENLTGLRVIRAFNAEAYQTEKFDEASESLMGTQLFTARMFSLMMPLMTLVMSGLTLAIYWVGAILLGQTAADGRLELFSNIVVFSTYATYVVMSFMMLIAIFMILPRAQVSAKRVLEVLDTEPAVREGELESGEEGLAGEIEFKNVSFAYPEAACNALSGISFRAKKGQTVAVIGSTGSGKTTLVNLLARLYDASEGVVLVDGRDVRDYKFNALYNKIGYIPQKAVLFNDSVENNLSFGDCGRTLEKAELESAIDIAQAREFVSAMPEGMSAEIARGGMNVSGGQKQRLSIARAIARRPEILIFDDSFSALDFKTESELRGRLKTELEGATCVIVAQRVGTIRGADIIIVLDEGEAAGIGAHEELMQSCAVYREIALSQLSAEELGEQEGGEQ